MLRWDSVKLVKHLTLVEETLLIFYSDVRRLHTREITIAKVYRRHFPVEKDTWDIVSNIWT